MVDCKQNQSRSDSRSPHSSSISNAYGVLPHTHMVKQVDDLPVCEVLSMYVMICISTDYFFPAASVIRYIITGML